MKRIVTVLGLLSLGSLAGCAATPEEMAAFNAQVNQLGQDASRWRDSSVQQMQANQQIFQQTTAQQSEWNQQQADGKTVHCIKVGIYISCK